MLFYSMQLKSIYQNYLSSTGICTDTRSLKKGEIFIALHGEKSNGNQFAEKAILLGANSVIVDDQKIASLSPKVIVVKDTLKTLQELATFHRTKLQTTIIAITGSNGKTTTKELIREVLSQRYSVLATDGNLNNHIGVPLTLLKLKEHHQLAIIEMGANHIKEIELLCNIAQPNWGYITNFGKAHLEGFGSIQGVVKGKSELYDHLIDRKQKILINGDDHKQIILTKNYPITSFGIGDENNLQFISQKNEYKTLQLKFKETTFISPLHGTYNSNNIAAAISFGYLFKVSLKEIKKAINTYQSTNNRSQQIRINDSLVIMDAYNANPSSMEVALKAFQTIATLNSCVVLGDMLELGDTSKKEHEEIILKCLQNKIQNIHLVGPHFLDTNNLDSTITKHKDVRTFLKFMKSSSLNFDKILIKGSRSIKLEGILPFLKSRL